MKIGNTASIQVHFPACYVSLPECTHVLIGKYTDTSYIDCLGMGIAVIRGCFLFWYRRCSAGWLKGYVGRNRTLKRWTKSEKDPPISWAQQLSQWLERYKSLWLKSEFNVLESTLPYLSLWKENYNIHPWPSTNPHRKKLNYIFVSRAHTLPETNGSPLKIGRAPTGNDRIPTIHFQFQGGYPSSHNPWFFVENGCISNNFLSFFESFSTELPWIYG